MKLWSTAGSTSEKKNGWATEMADAEYVGEITENRLLPEVIFQSMFSRIPAYSVEYNGLNASSCSSMMPDSQD